MDLALTWQAGLRLNWDAFVVKKPIDKVDSFRVLVILACSVVAEPNVLTNLLFPAEV